MTFSSPSASCYLKLPSDFFALCIHIVVSPNWFITLCMCFDRMSVYPSPAQTPKKNVEQTLAQKKIHVRWACDYNLLIEISRAVPVYYEEGPQCGGFPEPGTKTYFPDRDWPTETVGITGLDEDLVRMTRLKTKPCSGPSTITAYNMPFFFQGQALVNKTTITRVPAELNETLIFFQSWVPCRKNPHLFSKQTNKLKSKLIYYTYNQVLVKFFIQGEFNWDLIHSV